MAQSILPLPAKGWLVNHNIPITELAERLGYSQQYVGEVMNRTRPITRTFVQAAVAELGLDPDTAGLLFGPPGTWGRGRWPDRTV